MTYVPSPFGYGGETQVDTLLSVTRFFIQLQVKSNQSKILKALIAFPANFFKTLFALSVILKYDAFIFGFGFSLLPRGNWDLLLLKLLGKKIISNLALGSEARPAFIDGFFQDKNDSTYLSIEQIKSLAKRSKDRVAKHENYSNLIIGAPFSTSHYASQRFINAFALGLPFDAKNQSLCDVADSSIATESAGATCRILHSPSHPVAKGSKLIIQAIDRLKKKGHAIEFVMLKDRSNAEVLQELRRCDFVVDQLYSDTPMAGFANEAAWFGKPAVVGGYGFDHLKTFVPEAMWPPSKICHPDKIEQAIEDMIVNVDERQQLGAAAQKFVREKWNATEVARRYLRLIEGDIPEEWWLDPQDVIYVEGAGQSAERTKENIRQLVDKYGASSLQLSHRPELEKAFLEFAGVDKGR